MKLGICIPYRNRKKHLDELVEKLGKYLSKKNIDYKFYVAHQNDKKLFNRGAMKNIAAKHAFQDGCDYIAWHDVDMIPADDTADYSYPKDYPIHIATNLSKFDNGMRYEQYFGGVILFTKEQVNKINGYSNEYWDWGQEDDDLFWRCYSKNLVKIEKLVKYEDFVITKFNGKNSFISIEVDREFQATLNNSHTISILLRPEHAKNHKQYLIGDPDKKFIEYPIIRTDGKNNWGFSFNNSNALSFMCKDMQNNYYYNWGKRQSDIWTWLTVSYNKDKNLIYFLINDEIIFMENDVKKNYGFLLENKLKYFHNINNLIIGKDSNTNIFYKGDVAAIRIHDKFLSDIKNDLPKYYWDGKKNKFGNLNVKHYNTSLKSDKFEVIKSILPYRRNGNFICLPHKDEGFKNGEWIRKKTTSVNEKKLNKKLKLNNFNIDKDGINNVKYKLNSVENINNYLCILNVSL